MNSTGLLNVTQYANSVSGGGLGIVILIVLFVVSFGVMKVYPTKRALVSCLFFVNLMAVLEYYMEILDRAYLVGALMLLVFAIILLFVEGDT